MPRNGRPNRRVAYIGQGKGVARLGHHGADGGIMNVAYARKQVVLNLQIQPAKIPRDPGGVRGKIRRRLHLMLGPSRGHHTGVRIRVTLPRGCGPVMAFPEPSGEPEGRRLIGGPARPS